MKPVSLLIIFMISIGSSCISTQNKAIEKVVYSASTRGSSIQVVIIPNQLTVNEKVVEISAKNWKSLTRIIKTVDLENLSILEAPSQNRFRDAALAAELKIVTAEESFTSSQFDHGNPPEELKAIIAKILDLAGIK